MKSDPVIFLRTARNKTERVKGDYRDSAGVLLRSFSSDVEFKYLSEFKGYENGLLVTVGDATESFLSGVDPDVSGGFAHYSDVHDRIVFPVSDPGDCGDSEQVSRVKRHLDCLKAFVENRRFEYRIVESITDLSSFIQVVEQNSWMSYDFETTNLALFKDAKVLGVSMWTPGHVPVYVPMLRNPAVDAAWPDLLAEKDGSCQTDLFNDLEDAFVRCVDPAVLSLLEERLFFDKGVRKVAHNAYFDSLCAWKVFGRYPENAGTCTMLGKHVLDSTDRWHPLDAMVSLVPEASGYYHTVDRIRKKTKSFSRIPMVVQAEYCCGDSLVCGRGLEVMMPHVKIRKVRRLFDLQCDLVEIYAKASIRGLRIDLDYHSKLKERFTSECDVLGARFVADYGISAASPQQVTKFVFDELTTDVPVDRGSGDDTLKTILDSLGERDSLSNDETRLRKFIEDVREFRAVSKLLSTYIIGLEKHIVNGRVYPIANIGGARSGRMSYESPNIQNQPIRSEVGRLIRGIFVPDSGCLLECDASKAEMVTAAWLSGDERFIQYLTEYDIYMKVGEDVMRGPVTKRQRDLLWKPVVLANLYLAGSKRLQQAVNIGAEKPEDRITLKQAENLQSSLKRLFPDFDRWKQAQIREIEKNGCVINPFGRLRRGDVRYLFNTLIQSTCSDLIQFAIRNFCKEYGREIVPCDFAFNQHDAIYVDTAPDLIDDVVHAVKCSYSEEALPRGLTFMRLESKPYYERWGQ